MILVALPLHHQLSDFRQDFKEVMTVMMFPDDLDQRLYEKGAVLLRPERYVAWHSGKGQDKVKLSRKHTPWKGGLG